MIGKSQRIAKNVKKSSRLFPGAEMVRSTFELNERSPFESGFSVFKRRIGEQLQLNGFDDSLVDDEALLPYYRMGESETYVLGALGCFAGI